MLKKSLFATLALVAAFSAFQPVEKAEARVNVDIGIGVPYYGNGRYYEPYYYAAPRRRYYAPRPAPRRYGRLSCGEARRIVRNHGYRRVRAIDCSGNRYTFHAMRGGEWYRIRMRSRTGRIYKVQYF